MRVNPPGTQRPGAQRPGMQRRGVQRPGMQWLATIALRLLAVLLICGIATPSAAAGLGPLLPHLGVSATALSLMLATAASKPRN